MQTRAERRDQGGMTSTRSSMSLCYRRLSSARFARPRDRAGRPRPGTPLHQERPAGVVRDRGVGGRLDRCTPSHDGGDVMPIAQGRHTAGPDTGSLRVKTYREGVAAKVGHDLVIEVGSWEAI